MTSKDEFKKAAEIAGKNIKNARLKKNMSQEELALKSNVRIQYIKKIEEGKAYRLNILKAFSITKALGMKLDDLYKS